MTGADGHDPPMGCAMSDREPQCGPADGAEVAQQRSGTVMNGTTPAVRDELAPNRLLRVAINCGNPVLAQADATTGELRGASVDIAREIGRRLDVTIAFSKFDAAAKVFQAAVSGALDLVFLAIDPARASHILFTAPYVIIEGAYVVRQDSALRRVGDFDRPGVRIAVGKGAAYDLFLSRALKHATLIRSDTSAGALELFLDQGLDAAAGVRQPLDAFAATHPGLRVIEESFTAIRQAVGTPRGRNAARAWLHGLIEELKATGFVAEALERSGQREAAVAPAGADGQP